MEKRNKTVLGLIVLIILLLVGFGFIFKSNRSLNNRLKNTALAKELVEAEKLKLEKNIDQLKYKIKENYNETETLYQLIKEAKKEVEIKEQELYSVRNYSVKELKNKNAKLQKLLDKVNAEIQSLNEEKLSATKNVGELSSKLKEIEERNTLLMHENDVLKQTMGNNFRVEAMRRNGRLVVKAPRTQQIKVFFDMPKSNNPYNVGFSVLTPAKKEFQSNEKELAEIQQAEGTDSSQRFVLIFKPKEKLDKGIYVFKVSNNNLPVGNLEVRLR